MGSNSGNGASGTESAVGLSNAPAEFISAESGLNENFQLQNIISSGHAPGNSLRSGNLRGLSLAIPGLEDISASAMSATKTEQKMTFLDGCKIYPKAIAWSILVSSTIIMSGYDTTLINSLFSLPAFKQSYGKPVSSGPRDYEIPSAWQSALTSIGLIGEILGLFLNGFLADHLGYRCTTSLSLIWLSLATFMAVFARNMSMLLVSQLLCGISWGVFQTLATTYAAEIMPVGLRAYLLSNVNMCWLLGQLSAVAIVRALANTPLQWSYRIPFALQWAFAVPILVAVIFAPESPWWLIRHEKLDEARKALLRLTSRGSHSFNVDETIAMMRQTNDFEKIYLDNSRMSYIECFKGTHLRRTEITCMVWVTQAFSGLSFTGFTAYFYEQVGFNSQVSFDLAVGMYGLAILAGIISWLLYRVIGRRRLYIGGLLVLLTILTIAGIVGALPKTNAQSWALGSFLILLTFVYDMTIGPVCYILIAEIPSTRLRVKTVVLARAAFNIATIVTNSITPRMLNPADWNWKGKSCFLYAGTTVLCLAWCYWRLPETSGLSYLEIDILFERRAKATKFREVQANLENTGYFDLCAGEQRSCLWQGY